MIMRSRKVRQRGQATLIGMLVALAIVIILAAMYFPQIAGNHSAPGQAPTPRERAYNTACSEYESQMNQAAFMYKNDHDDHPPRSLEQLKQYGVTEDMIHSEGCYFQIDPSTGHVSDVGQGRYVPVNPPASAIYSGRATGFHPDDPSARPAPSPNPGYAPPAPSAPVDGGSQAPTDGGGTAGPGGIKIPTVPTVDPSQY